VAVSERRSFQRFEVIDQLGAGGMATVFRARDPQLERDVAIKVLHATPTSAVSTLSTYRTVNLREAAVTPPGDLLGEARMMARMSHPNVLPVYEVGLDGNSVFLVMEHIEGSDLRAWLATPRTTVQILEVFAQAGRGLLAAHAKGIVHRDFKPDNVLIGTDGRVRVADFGISRLVTSNPRPSSLEDEHGTPIYMAPEVWRGERASARSDSFAFCTALAEAFGAPPGAPRIVVERDRQKAVLGGVVAEDVRERSSDDRAEAPVDQRPWSVLA